MVGEVGEGRSRSGAGEWSAGLFQDMRVGWRRMVRAPGFTAVAVISIAIGVGGNTALFTLIEALILRPPPYADPEELVDIRLTEPGDAFGTFSYLTFREMEEATKPVFDGVAGVMFNMVNLSDGTGRRENLLNELVAGPYFQVLGVGAQVGRVFDADEGLDAGADPVVVLSDGYWHRAFGADPGVVGQTVRLNGYAYTIIGVAQPEFIGVFPGLRPDIWAHASMSDQISLNGPGSLGNRGQESFMVKARLADGVTLAEAETVVGTFAEDLFPAHGDRYVDHRMQVTLTLASPVHPALDRVVVPVAGLVMVVVALVLLIACVNLAGFLLARAAGRRREIAVRLALGAGRGRLIRGLLTETTMLAVLGGAAGVFLSVFLVDLMLSIELPFPVPITVDARLNLTVLLFALGASLFAGLVLGLAPALQSTRPDVSSTLKDENTGGGGRAARMRSALVIGQVAGTVVLLVAAGLFTRSLITAQSVDPGFGQYPAAIAWMEPGPSRTPEERRAFYDTYLERVGALPGVVSVGTVTIIPLEGTGTSTIGLVVPGVEPPPGRNSHEVDWAGVGGDYFDAVGIPLVAGRFFDERDNMDSDPVAVVSETMATRFWPDQDAVGRTYTSGGTEVRVVGVAGDTKVRTLSEPPRPLVYGPAGQMPYLHGRVVARTALDPAPVLPAMLALATELDPGVITINAKTMEQHLSFMLIPARISAVMLGLMGALALLLAAIGLYGIVAYSVASRGRELGIRMSVGADPGRLVAMVLRGGLKLVAAGLVIGLALAVVLARVIQGSLYGVSSFDPVTFGGVAVVLTAVATLAAYLPARRASRVDPVHALKQG